LIPDLNTLQGTGEVGGYMVFRFTTAPTDRDITDVKTRDERIDSAILRPTERVDGGYTDTSFDLHMPESDESSRDLKRKFETYSEDGPEEDDADAVRLPHLRRYETKTKMQYHDVKHNPLEEIAFVLHKGDKAAGERNSALYYPVLGRYSLRPKRKTKYIPGIGGGEDEDELIPNVDELRVKLRGLTDEEKRSTQRLVPTWEGRQVEGGGQEGGMPAATQESQDADGEEDAPGESDDGN
jgi:RNA polymerase II-associated factor 1